jgi:energy-coupling factor transport system permease protein
MSMPNALPVTLVPGNSFVHRINPIAKLAWLVSYIALAFATQNIVVLYAMVVLIFLIGVSSGIAKHLLKGMAILIPLGGSLLFIQAVAPAIPQPWTPIVSLGPFTIYQEGVYSGLVLFGRIAACLIAAFVLVMTTHQNDLFASLSRLKVPYLLNFMMAMTLQLLPLFQREVGIIMSAQKSRGMKGRGFAAVLPSFIPVFVGAIERVQQLSVSLESRGFGSQGNRTSYRRLTVRPSDWVIGAIGVIGAAALITLSIMNGLWSLNAQIPFSPAFALSLVIVAAVGFVGTIGLVVVYGLRK